MISDQGKVTKGMMDHMSNCKLNVKPSKNSHEVMEAFAHVFQSVMKNFAYLAQLSPRKRCESVQYVPDATVFTSMPTWKLVYSSIQLISTPYSGNIPHQFPLVTENKENSLQFIACGGQPSVSSLSYREFVTGFDLCIWIYTGISVAVVTVLLWCSARNETVPKPCIRYFETIFRLLINQCDQYLDKLHQTSSRCLISWFGLAAVVLNCAYKNDNIYRMALPRNPIYLETLDDIVKNNFTIFTRSSRLFIFKGWSKTTNYSNIQIQSRSGHTIRDPGMSYFLADSEVYEEYYSFGRIRGTNASGELVYEKSKLHPKLFKTLKEIISLNIDYNNLTWSEVEKNLKKLFWEKEDEILINELGLCKNIAVVVPPQKRNEIGRKMLTNDFRNKNNKLHIGKEVVFKSFTVFSLRGLVPPFVISRMKQIGSSGILDRWIKLLSGDKVTLNLRALDGSELHRPSMKGNILTVFVVMLAGNVNSFIYFRTVLPIFEQV